MYRVQSYYHQGTPYTVKTYVLGRYQYPQAGIVELFPATLAAQAFSSDPNSAIRSQKLRAFVRSTGNYSHYSHFSQPTQISLWPALSFVSFTPSTSTHNSPVPCHHVVCYAPRFFRPEDIFEGSGLSVHLLHGRPLLLGEDPGMFHAASGLSNRLACLSFGIGLIRGSH